MDNVYITPYCTVLYFNSSIVREADIGTDSEDTMHPVRNFNTIYSLQLSSRVSSLGTGGMAATSSLVNEAIFPTLQKVGSVPVLRDCMTDDIVMEGYHGCESLGMLLSRSFQELQYEMLTCQQVNVSALNSTSLRYCITMYPNYSSTMNYRCVAAAL